MVQLANGTTNSSRGRLTTPASLDVIQESLGAISKPLLFCAPPETKPYPCVLGHDLPPNRLGMLAESGIESAEFVLRYLIELKIELLSVTFEWCRSDLGTQTNFFRLTAKLILATCLGWILAVSYLVDAAITVLQSDNPLGHYARNLRAGVVLCRAIMQPELPPSGRVRMAWRFF